MSAAVIFVIIEIANCFAHGEQCDECMVTFEFAAALDSACFSKFVIHHISLVGQGMGLETPQ